MMTPLTGSRGISRCFNSPRRRCLRVSRSAPHSTNASLAASDGCSRNGPPKSIQFWFPLTDTPMPGTRTRHNNPMATMSAG